MQQQEDIQRALQLEVARITHQFPPNKTITVQVVELPDEPGPSGRAITGESDDGAAFYVLTFLFVYGVVAAFLIFSNVARSRRKMVRDHQINEYLKVARVVRRTSSRSHRHHRKLAVVAKLNASPPMPPFCLSGVVPRPSGVRGGHPRPGCSGAEAVSLLPTETTACETLRMPLETRLPLSRVSESDEIRADIGENGDRCIVQYDFESQTPIQRINIA